MPEDQRELPLVSRGPDESANPAGDAGAEIQGGLSEEAQRTGRPAEIGGEPACLPGQEGGGGLRVAAEPGQIAHAQDRDFRQRISVHPGPEPGEGRRGAEVQAAETQFRGHAP